MFPLSDPILIFTVLILTMLIAPLLAGRYRVPDLIFLLVSGTLLGPNGFGVLERGPAVVLFGSVGLLYIMFLAGLEIDLYRFASAGRRIAGFGMLTFLIPQILGTLAGRYLLGFDWTPSILLASMFASHTLLAYPIASRLGIARNEPVSVAVGATIVTDTLALLVLAVIADSTRGEQLGLRFWVGICAGMCVLIALIWWGIPKLAHWFFHNVTEAGGEQFLFVLVAVCGCAYLSHFAKMEPIIGAFLAGAAFNRLIPPHSALMNRVVFAGNNLFIPFFLISVGMLVKPLVIISSPQSWVVALTMIVAVIVSKYLAAWIASKWFGYDANARKVMFGLSVVQAAATLAAVLVGYDLKIFDESVLNGSIIMIAVTCPLGAWMVDRNGRRMAAASPRHVQSLSHEQNIMVSVSNPHLGLKLLDLTFMLRNNSVRGGIHPITVVRDDSDAANGIISGERLMAHFLTHAASVEMPIIPSVRVDVNVSDGIVRAAKELRSSMVVAGFGLKRPFGNRIFPTVMGNLLDSCPARLLLCRIPKPLNITKRLVLMVPSLAERRSDLKLLIGDAKRLSQQVGAEIIVYMVGADTSEFRKCFQAVQPHRQCSFVDAKSLTDISNRLVADTKPDDMIMPFAERRSSSLWTPTLESLPRLLVSMFPDNNLLIAYPPLRINWDEQAAITEMPDQLRMFSCDVEQGIDLQDALVKMATGAFGADGELAAEVKKLLMDSANSFPVELVPGVVLLHGHSEMLTHPVVLVAQKEGEGWSFKGIKTPAALLIGLLSPQTANPEQHLKWLNYLAQCFYNPSKSSRIINSATAGDVCRILGEELAQD